MRFRKCQMRAKKRWPNNSPCYKLTRWVLRQLCFSDRWRWFRSSSCVYVSNFHDLKLDWGRNRNPVIWIIYQSLCIKLSCFVLDVLVGSLLSSMAVFVPCDRKLQRAYCGLKFDELNHSHISEKKCTNSDKLFKLRVSVPSPIEFKVMKVWYIHTWRWMKA